MFQVYIRDPIQKCSTRATWHTSICRFRVYKPARVAHGIFIYKCTLHIAPHVTDLPCSAGLFYWNFTICMVDMNALALRQMLPIRTYTHTCPFSPIALNVRPKLCSKTSIQKSVVESGPHAAQSRTCIHTTSWFLFLVFFCDTLKQLQPERHRFASVFAFLQADLQTSFAQLLDDCFWASASVQSQPDFDRTEVILRKVYFQT